MLYRLARLLFGTPEDIDLAPALGRMQPVEIHSYSSQDFGTCRELYLLNEPGRFPPGVLPDFEATLREDNRLFLVAKMAGKLCGCGGISIKEQSGTSIGWLCFGLIHPKHHGQGIGAALLLARLSLLPTELRWAAMCTVPKSRGYYERFNFHECVRGKWPDGTDAPVHRVRLPPRTRSRCESLLSRAGVILTLDTKEVPVSSWQ